MAESFKVSAVVAATKDWGIGFSGGLPWPRLAADMTHFRNVTSSAPSGLVNAVVMGRKTWESIPSKFRPLPGRVNVVLTSDSSYRSSAAVPAAVILAKSFPDALAQLTSAKLPIHTVFAIGGKSVYEEALAMPQCASVHLTRVFGEFDCDVFMPALSELPFVQTETQDVQEANGVKFQITVQSRITAESGTGSGAGAGSSSTAFTETKAKEEADMEGRATTTTTTTTTTTSLRSSRPSGGFAATSRHEEYQYLDLIRDILDSGIKRGDRTGTGTLSKFGATMRFSLRDGVLPVLTTKKVFWRGVAEELLWFISGDTSAKTLQDKRIHIWDGNGSKEFLESRGLGHREEGDLGPVYGFQWRHFGAKYVDMHTDYTGQGVDQLANVIHTIKTNPNDRRIVLSAWNPAALPDMALPPCHMFCQFYVADGELSCQMYQRSADMGLGVPFNIASYSLLTRLIAQVCGLKAGEFVHVIGDAHVYLNHVEPLERQLEREPRSFPVLRIDPSITDIDDFRYEHLTLEGYDPMPSIKMKMAV